MITYSIIKKSQLEGALRLDAEYYQPEYLDLEIKIKKQNTKLLRELAQNIICGPFGSAVLNEDYRESGTPLLRVSDLNDWFVKTDDLVFIDEELSQKMRRYWVADEDIVVSQRGTIAMFSKVTNKFSKWNISANLISIKKSNKINFDYLLAFLNSFFGINQLFRRLSGQVQPKITTEDIKNISVFIPTPKEQEEIAKFVKKSWGQQESSMNLYQRAENLLLEELGIKDFENKESLFSIVDLSDVKKANRIDAEYFQDKYKKLISSLKNCGIRKLSEIAERKNDVVKINPESEYKYIEISDINVGNGEILFNVIRGKDLPANAKIKIAGSELVISKVRPTRGAIAIVPENWNDNFIASGAFSVFEIGSPMRECLQIILRSIIGKLQLEKPTTGTSYPTVTDEDVENLMIPILSKNVQQKIADLVKKSHGARKKAKELLDEAKTKVESLIENNK